MYLIYLNTEILYNKFSVELNKLLGHFSREIGFVVFNQELKDSCMVRDGKKPRMYLLICVDGETQKILGGCQCYLRKDGVLKIYAIGVDRNELRKGIGRKLIERLDNDFPKIEVNCLEDIDANFFYESVLFTLFSTKVTKKGSIINMYRNYEKA